MAQVNTTERLQKLRELMKENGMDVYIVPSEDEHYSEYIAATDKLRHYISGFTGSAGVAVVTQDKAALATDGRYFNQAGKQLDSNWELLKQGLEDVLTWKEWAAKESEGGKIVGVDSRLIPAGEARKLREQIKKSGGAGLKGTTMNLVAKVWGAERPGRPAEPVKLHDVKYAGKSMQEKIAELRKELDKQKSAGFVVSMLDEIAWLCNLRGSDIPFNPVFFSYAVVTPSAALLYVDKRKLGDDVVKHLGDFVEIRPYQAIFGDLLIMKEEAEAEAKDKPADFVQRKFSISNKASLALSEALGGEDNVNEIRSPIGDAKAIKNDTELEGMRQCHIRDGAALSEYFAWLEDQLIHQKATLNEAEAADKLEQIRSKHEHFMGLSFDTISSTGANAAVIHYKPEHDSCATIDPKAIYLCDSGAQYLDGTTDTTRTMHFGEPTALERKAFTLVLKGTIALDRAVFPKGTTGLALDALARQFLWEEGLDYRHGTGHGVGSFLNVHEGPIGVGTRVQYSEVPLSAGNVISDEPGYYEDGSFGIRIENIIMAKEVKTTHGFGGKPWLGFEHVTMTPICRKLIDTTLLSQREVQWIDDYHTEIWERTKSFFEGKDEKTLQWLKRETAKL